MPGFIAAVPDRFAGSAANLWRRKYQVLVDVAVLAAAFNLAYLLRFDFQIPPRELDNFWAQLPWVVGFQLLVAGLCGVYQFIWRCVSMSELGAFVCASLTSALPILALRLGLPDELNVWRVPLSVLIVDTGAGFGGMLLARLLRRMIFERFEYRTDDRPVSHQGERVLLIGAGRFGKALLEEVRSGRRTDLDIRGFIDDDPFKASSKIYGISVLGRVEDLPRLVREHQIDHVIITIASASRAEFRRIFEICESIPVKTRVIPSLRELLYNRVQVSRVRELDISDLLGRPPVQLDNSPVLDFLRGRCVMVTGAGGSIGSELARQIAYAKPAQLILLERAEPSLFKIDMELRQAFPDLLIVPAVVDINNERGLRRIFEEHHPAVVIHAAAHKHVPMMEHNVMEALTNNVLGTRMVAELSGQYGVEVFTLISSDKAVRPSSVMGSTKRLAELTIQDLGRRYDTVYVAVRFGNVIGSTGSVIPIFYEQIKRGAPVTVTHPKMMRYFMTIPEAAQLVLEATTMGQGGEIFILDMGEPVRIVTLAEQMIRLAGLRPYEDIPIAFTGMRPGEKLVEELEIKEESMSKTRHPKIFIGKIAGHAPGEIIAGIDRLIQAAETDGCEAARAMLQELLPEARLSGEPESLGRAAAAAAGAGGGGRMADRLGALQAAGQ